MQVVLTITLDLNADTKADAHAAIGRIMSAFEMNDEVGPTFRLVDPAPEHGTELDADGLPHDARIHAPGKVRNADGRWRAKRNVDDATREKVTAELRTIMAASAEGGAIVATGAADQVRDASSGPCNLGVGCDEAGVCYAEAMGSPDRCPHTPVGISGPTAGLLTLAAGVADRLSTRIDQMLDGAAPPPPPPVTAIDLIGDRAFAHAGGATVEVSPPTAPLPPPPPPAAVTALFAPEAPAHGFGEFVDWLGDELSRATDPAFTGPKVTDEMWQSVLRDLGLPGIAALDHRPDLVATARQRIEALRDAGGAE